MVQDVLMCKFRKMDQQQLLLTLTQYKVPCPHHWMTTIEPLQNETLSQNYVRFFSEYLPPIRGTPLTISFVGPINNKRKPYCQWVVYFRHILPLERGLYQNIRLHLDENKPRNTLMKLSAQDEHNFVATYRMCCQCKFWDFSVNDETNLLVNFPKIKVELLD